MIETLQSEPAKALCKRRKQTVEPALGFRQFSPRGIENVKTEWQLLTLACNCKRLAKLTASERA